jgi:hypothetical protein
VWPPVVSSPLVRYLLRRLGVSALLIVGVTLVTFVLAKSVTGAAYNPIWTLDLGSVGVAAGGQ